MPCLSKKFTNKLLGTLPGCVLYNPQAESESKRFKCSRLQVSDPWRCLGTIKPQHNISSAADNKCITSTFPNVLVRIALRVQITAILCA